MTKGLYDVLKFHISVNTGSFTRIPPALTENNESNPTLTPSDNKYITMYMKPSSLQYVWVSHNGKTNLILSQIYTSYRKSSNMCIDSEAKTTIGSITAVIIDRIHDVTHDRPERRMDVIWFPGHLLADGNERDDTKICSNNSESPHLNTLRSQVMFSSIHQGHDEEIKQRVAKTAHQPQRISTKTRS